APRPGRAPREDGNGMADELQDLVERVAAYLRVAPGSPPPPRVQRQLPSRAADIAPFIDHTLLRPDAAPDAIETLCAEARAHGFATVCVNGSQVALAARLLAGSAVRPIAVVGFPLGATTTEAKAFEAADAVRNGAREIDMVLAIGAL